VYRTDAAPRPAPAGPALASAAPAAILSRRPVAVASPPPRDGTATSALDLVTWPLSFLTTFALAPVQWLIGSKRP